MRDGIDPRSEDGAVLALVGLLLTVLLLVGAVAVDISALQRRGQTLQNVADSAALAGAEVWTDSGDPAAVAAIVGKIIAQNGIDLLGDTSLEITYPSSTQITVALTDSEPEVFLSSVVGIGNSLERDATARYERCDAGCAQIVPLPPPFTVVEVAGAGDGYAPISVGERLYAINHYSSDVACVDRIAVQRCWSEGSRPAYSSDDKTPQMPHAAVHGSRFWWVASNSSGTYLHCWESITDLPCAQSYQLNSRARSTSLRSAGMRGGGAIIVGKQIYAFTDDHRVHCFDPTMLATCTGYASHGLPSALSVHGFPTNEPSDLNAGGSIDRIADPATGRIYSTLHIENAASGFTTPEAVDCSANPSQPEGTVIIKNVATGRYLAAQSAPPSDSIEMITDYTDSRAHWSATADIDGLHYFQSLLNGVAGYWIDSDALDSELDLSSTPAADDSWELLSFDNTSFEVRAALKGGYMTDDAGVATHASAALLDKSRWIIRPWQCEDPAYQPPPQLSNPAVYGDGTWLHCWDSTIAAPCTDFTPYRLHSSANRASGRLFFYRDDNAAKTVVGICSGGYDGSVSASNYEITCLDIDGDPAPWQEASLADLRNAVVSRGIANNTWGDPHWNEATNRVFMPSNRKKSTVFCFDFDSGYCGQRNGATVLGPTYDYGYISEGTCVIGLGHAAVFWAFDATDMSDGCSTSSVRTTMSPCSCSGRASWGRVDFDVDLALYDRFEVQVVDPSGNPVHPPSGEPLDLLTHGDTTVDLTTISTTLYSTLELLVVMDSNKDPWSKGDQTLTLNFSNEAPRLVE